jgi:hypothetical protein
VIHCSQAVVGVMHGATGAELGTGVDVRRPVRARRRGLGMEALSG